MTLCFKHNAQLELNRVEYSGALAPKELYAHAHFRGAHGQWLNYDHLNLVLPGADASQLSNTMLDAIYAQHQALFQTEKLLILRRSAWVCQSAAAMGALRYWLGDRFTKPRAYTDVRLFETIEDACDWLLLQGHEKALAVRGEGFEEIARFTAPSIAA